MNGVMPEGAVGGTTLMSSSIRATDISQKYAGMIELSTYKKTRNALFQLFDYVSQTAPPFFAMHVVVSIWRIIQYFGSCFCCRYYAFWGVGTVMDTTSDVLTVFSHILPARVREEADVWMLYAYSALFVVFYGFLAASTFYFAKNAKLPKVIPPMISIFVGTFGYLLQPPSMCFIMETVGRMIMDPDRWVNAVNIVAIVLSALVLIIFMWLYATIYSVTITFKPDSLQVIIPSVQVSVMIATLIINALIGVAGELSKIPRLVITGIAGVWCFTAISFLFQKGGLVSRGYEKALGASSMAEGLLFFVVIIYEVLNKQANEIIIFVVAGVWILSFLCFHFYFERRARKCMELLDMIEDGAENFDLIKSPRQLAGVAVIGFRFAHPVCLSWQLFKLGIERWPGNVDIWLLFAKMTAIYPEETQQLNWISMGMAQNHLKGSLAKHTQQQIGLIMKQRETNLIPELKTKLDKIGKQVQGTKHKIRYIWDLIIQGNISELETVISRAFGAIDVCEAEFLHLLRQFPNSRFVARAYARFLRDVVADHAAHKIWSQNVSMLQRGIPVVPDQAHELGLRAFPLLPKTVDAQMQIQQTQGMITDDTLTQDIEADDEQATMDAELRMSVRESINKLVIPSFRMAKCLRLWFLIIIFFAPVLGITIYYPIYVQGLTEPLHIMFTLSQIRTLLLQLVGVGFHFVCERCKIVDVPDSGDPEPATFGSSHNSSHQVAYLAQEVVDMLPSLTEITGFKQGDEHMDEVRRYIFENTIEFRYIYNVNEEPKTELISLNKIFMEYVVLLRELIQLSDYENPNNYTDGFPVDTIFTMKYVSIPFNNIQPVTENITTVIELVTDYVQQSYTTMVRTTLIMRLVIMIVIPIIFILITVYIIKRIQADKMMIYKCLASLPKNVVSKVADSFKVLKKEEDEEIKTSQSHDEEINKQEENVLKIFATSTDAGGGKAADTMILAVMTVIVVGCFLGAAAVIIQFLEDTSSRLNESAPHIDYIMGSYTYDFSSVIVLIMLGASFSGHDVYGFPHDEMIATINKWQDRGIEAYRSARFGIPDRGIVPFYGFSQGLDAEAPLAGCAVQFIPTTDHEVYKCWGADLLTSYIQMHVHSYVELHQLHRADGNIQKANFTMKGERKFIDMWHIHQVHLYDRYFAPMFQKIIPNINELVSSDLHMVMAVSWVLFAVALICEIAVVTTLITSEQRQKFALRLLLQCPGNVVVANSNITTLLSGNFNSKQVDSTTRDAEFYDVIVQDMPDAILTTDIEGKILSANKACERIFGIVPSELVQTSVIDLGEKLKEENVFKFFTDKTLVNEQANFEKVMAYNNPNQGEVQLELNFSVLQEHCIVTARDVTQNVMYNRLISDERARSDHLLSSILPSRLVPRVQAGEQNISFAVTSASIVFMDIVSFTPWCGSLPAATVMKTLNLMFKEYDALVAIHTTMTKIKCIGDCYMAAGGIFMDVNQPAQHAKDVVEFGLDAINALEKIDKEIDQQLQIRVGVNTGGPIVAGVLGTAKPTFEILGPAINMAQQMEHHGVPMKVHVSRAVYELIYGGTFKVKERGEVQLKNGPAVTYLIDKRPSK